MQFDANRFFVAYNNTHYSDGAFGGALQLFSAARSRCDAQPGERESILMIVSIDEKVLFQNYFSIPSANFSPTPPRFMVILS